jgi:hypothetical protein
MDAKISNTGVPGVPGPTGPAGPVSNFVFQPGGATVGNIYASWAALYAALNAVTGPKVVLIDDSFTSPAVIPAGTYNVNYVTFTGVANGTTNSGGASLTLADGCHFSASATTVIHFNGALYVTSAAATDIISAGNGTTVNVFFQDACFITMTGAGAFLHCTGTGVGYISGQTLNFGDGSHAVLVVDATALGYLQVFDASVIHGSSVSAAAANVLSVYYDNSTDFTGIAATNVYYVLQDYAPGTPGYNPFWYAATTIYVDPQNSSGHASDFNPGTSSSTPLLTWAEVVRRYGSFSPEFNYGQSCTYTFLSGQTAGTDPIFFEPRVSGGGYAVLMGTLTAVGVPQSITVNASLTRGAPGNLLTLANLTGGAANLLVVNTTRSSQAFIDSVGATTIMQQPQTTASLTTITVPVPIEDNAWATSNTVQLYSLLSLNLKRWRPVGGDETAGGVPSSGWVFYVDIVDISGASTASAYLFGSACTSNVLVNCIIGTRLHVSAEGGRGFSGLYVNGCSLIGAAFVGAAEAAFYGGALKVGGNFFGVPTFTNDVILHGTVQALEGSLDLGNVFCDGTVNAGSAPSGGLGNIQASGSVWGSFSLNVAPGSAYINATGSTFAAHALLTSGTIKLNGATTGTSYISGQWTNDITITPANLDTYVGLQDPRSGARIANSGAAADTTSTPAPGTPAYNSTWYAATAIYIDPQNSSTHASDTNNGTTSITPLLTWAEVIRRYGSTSPVFNYGQSCTYTFLSAQTAGTDPIFFEPMISGGGHVALIGTPTLVADIPVGGTVTAKSKGAPGTRLQVASMPAGTSAGMWVHNITRSSSAFIDSMAVLVATMQQPMPDSLTMTIGLPSASEDNTWTTGDHLQTYTLPIMNLKRWCPVGGDVSSAGGNPPCVGWVQQVEIVDSSAGVLSAYLHSCKCATNVLSLCKVDPRLSTSAEGGRGFCAYVLCSTVEGLIFVNGETILAGGGAAAGITGVGFFNSTNGSTIHGAFQMEGASATICSGSSDDVFCDGTVTPRACMFSVVGDFWGSYSVNLLPGGRYVNGVGGASSWTNNALLTTGALTMGGASTGWTATAGSPPVWASGVALGTGGADLDAAPGQAIFDPLTGAGFSLAF